MIPPHVPNATFKSYITFLLDSLDTESAIDSVIMKMWSHPNGMTGNSNHDDWPGWAIWDVPGGDTIQCWLDLVDYGNELDVGDWTAGDPGDSQTIQSHYTPITLNDWDPETYYFSINVTEALLNRIDNGREKLQFRIAFGIDTDFDDRKDFLTGRVGNPDYPLELFFYHSASHIENCYNIKASSIFCIENHHNPFNPTTTIEYKINEPGEAQIEIYNIKGQLVEQLLNENKDAGTYSVVWDGKDSAGNSVGSGVYFCRLKCNKKTETHKLLLMK